MDYLEKQIIAKLLHADLSKIDSYLYNKGVNNMVSMILIKQAFASISNLVDLEKTVRPIYKEHRNLSKLFGEKKNEFKFAKYLRNIFIGHLNMKLLNKALEWKPEIKGILAYDPEKYVYFLNICVLETAINSYVDSEGNNKVFGSELDLLYPPDEEKFLVYLTSVIKSGIQYLESLSEVLSAYTVNMRGEPNDLKCWIKAGQTSFKYIKK